MRTTEGNVLFRQAYRPPPQPTSVDHDAPNVYSSFVGPGYFDPETMVTAAVVLLFSACVAATVPAWRAAHVDPAVALRAET